MRAWSTGIWPTRKTERKEERAFAAGARIQHGDYGREPLAMIYEWRTGGRGKGRLAKNSDEEINDALRLAVAAKTERSAVAVLTGLQGVDVPVASAVLTAIDQERYTVIDVRALESLRDHNNRSNSQLLSGIFSIVPGESQRMESIAPEV